MSKKPEATFRYSVNRYISDDVYYQSMDGTATAGTPDSYYECRGANAWVEWKFSKAKMPRKLKKLTVLQQGWLNRAYDNGVVVAIIVGCPSGGYVCEGIDNYEDNNFLGPLSRANTMKWIEDHLLRRAR